MEFDLSFQPPEIYFDGNSERAHRDPSEVAQEFRPFEGSCVKKILDLPEFTILDSGSYRSSPSNSSTVTPACLRIPRRVPGFNSA